MGWWIALGVLILLAVLPLGVRAAYDADGPQLWVVIGPVRLQLLPGKGKDKKTKEEKPKKEPKEKPKAAGSTGAKKKDKGGPISDFLPLVQILLDLLADFKGKLRVDILELDLVLAGGDPCDLGIKYGKAWAALGNLWPRLEEFLVIKKRDVEIQCDFESSTTRITARLQLTITLGRLLTMVTWHGCRAVKEFLKIRKKRKGGAIK